MILGPWPFSLFDPHSCLLFCQDFLFPVKSALLNYSNIAGEFVSYSYLLKWLLNLSCSPFQFSGKHFRGMGLNSDLFGVFLLLLISQLWLCSVPWWNGCFKVVSHTRLYLTPPLFSSSCLSNTHKELWRCCLTAQCYKITSNHYNRLLLPFSCPLF